METVRKLVVTWRKVTQNTRVKQKCIAPLLRKQHRIISLIAGSLS
nr:MAG TPA: hypothetical protein [Caudoviricetes sp.]